mmetsp:Transcript_5495/g.13268  ORF Transcript_5495/g.13268 Transcript_5495/m.13268 type:complete len:248 (+) Transcript_5495:335-1078(+)
MANSALLDLRGRRGSKARRELQHIGKDSGRRSFRARTRSLDDERLLLVPHCREGANIIRPLQAAEGVVQRVLADLDLDLPARDVDNADVAQLLLVADRVRTHVRELLVVVRKLLHKLGHRQLQLVQRGGDEGLHGHVLGLDHDADLAGEDDGLALDVNAREVVAGVGLGVSESLRLCDDLGKRDGAVELVEDVAEGAGEDAFDVEEAVAGAVQGLDGADDGEACADVGLVEEVCVCRELGLADGGPE